MSSDWLSPPEEAAALAYLEDRFGIPPAALADHRLLRRGEHVCALHRDAAELSDDLAVACAGLKLLKETGGGNFKPSTRGMQVFGRSASRNVVDLTEAEVKGLVEGRSYPRPGERGYVLLRCGAAVIGVGLVRDDQLVSQLPRNLTMYLRLPGGLPRE